MASDILDVLNISEETRVQNQGLKKRQNESAADLANKRRKRGAMSRELYNLIGPNLPPVSLHDQSVKFKDRLKSQEASHWVQKVFKNGARDDKGLMLHHWVKSTSKAGGSKEEVDNETQPEDVYRFEKYNTELDIPGFTEEYYNEHLSQLDSSWNYEETRYLFDIAKLYDLRWAVIADNYEYDGEIGETVAASEEEAKEVSAGEEGEKAEEKNNNENDAAKDEEEQDEKDKKDDEEEKDEGELKEEEEDEEKDEKDEKDEEEGKQEGDEEPIKTNSAEGDSNMDGDESEISLKGDASERDTEKEAKESGETSDNGPEDNKPVEEGSGRTIEDLKARLYRVSAEILENQPDSVKDATLIRNLNAFDPNKEIERRRYLTHLLERSPTEIAEEESLVIEARKLELAAKKMLTERAQLLQLLDSPQASASIQKYMTSAGLTQLYNSLMNADKSKKRKPEAPVAPQLGPNALPHTQLLQTSQQQANQQHGNHSRNKKKHRSGSPALQSGSAPFSENEGTEIQQLLQSRLTPEQMEVYGITVHSEKIQPGVIIRSQKLPTFKPAVQAKVVETMNELGIAMRPTMPTAKVCSKFERLLHSIASLIDLKKQTDNLETEISMIKRQKGTE